MAALTQYGRPKKITFGTPVLTINDLTDLDVSFDPELIEHFGGASRFPRYTIGADNTTITFTTTDVAALGLVKGMEVATVATEFEGPDTIVNADGTRTQTSGTIGFSISNMRVTEAFRLKNDPSGKPGEISVSLRAAVKKGDGTIPTITFDVTL